MTDKKLIAGCKVNDPIAQKELYKKYYPTLMSYCMRYSRHRAEAEDWSQDVFLKVYDKIGVRPIKYLEAWLRVVAKNYCLDQVRKKRDIIIKDEEVYDDMMGNIKDEIEIELDFDDAIVSTDEIMSSLLELSVGYRRVFNMYIFEGYIHQEIAEKLGISEGTSKSNLHKAKKKLKKKLNERIKRSREALITV